MAIDVEIGRREQEEPHRSTPELSLTIAGFLQNKWMQGAVVAICLFFIYFVTSSESNPYNQYVRLADSFLHGRLYLEKAPEYLELAPYYDNSMACKGPEEGCKGYVSTHPPPQCC
jgi:hypothetical protein